MNSGLEAQKYKCGLFAASQILVTVPPPPPPPPPKKKKCTYLLILLKTIYCFVIHEVQPLIIILSVISLFEKYLYYVGKHYILKWQKY